MNIYLSVIKPFSTPKERMSRSLDQKKHHWAETLKTDKWKKNHDWDPTKQFTCSAGFTFIIDTEDDVYCLFAAERRTENGLVLHPPGGKANRDENGKMIENAWDAACRESMEESDQFLTPELSRQVEVSFAVGLSKHLLFGLEVKDTKGKKDEMSNLYPEQKAKIEFNKEIVAQVTNTRVNAKLAHFPCHPYSYQTKNELKSPTIASFPLYYDYERFKGNDPGPMPVIGSVSADRESREKVTAVPAPNSADTSDTASESINTTSSDIPDNASPQNVTPPPQTVIPFSEQLSPDKAISYHWISLKSLSENTFQRISQIEWHEKREEWYGGKKKWPQKTDERHEEMKPGSEKWDDFSKKKPFYHRPGAPYRYKYKPHKNQKGWQAYYDEFITQMTRLDTPQPIPESIENEKPKVSELPKENNSSPNAEQVPKETKNPSECGEIESSSPNTDQVKKDQLLTEERNWTLREITDPGLEMVSKPPGATEHPTPRKFVTVAETITGLQFPLSGLAIGSLCAPGGILDRYGVKFFPHEKVDSAPSNTTPTPHVKASTQTQSPKVLQNNSFGAFLQFDSD
jgi:hypothetical protein